MAAKSGRCRERMATLTCQVAEEWYPQASVVVANVRVKHEVRMIEICSVKQSSARVPTILGYTPCSLSFRRARTWSQTGESSRSCLDPALGPHFTVV